MTPPLLKLAVIGSGPAAFYVTSRIFSLIPKTNPLHDAVRIHMFDRNWAPHGLVRYGVAPDHPEVKNCTHKFDVVASDPRFKFFGNVDIIPPSPKWPFSSAPNPSPASPHSTSPVPLSLTSLFPHYTHLIIASGAPVPTLHPRLRPTPGKVVPALDVVHWYTGHPSAPSSSPPHKTDPLPSPLPSHVTVLGQGNVALDIARILLSDPSRLEPYDLPAHVISALEKSHVKHVTVLGRRGPAQASFTAKELREMMRLPNVAFEPVRDDVLAELDGVKLERQQKRVLDIMKKGSEAKKGAPGVTRSWNLEFWRSPTGMQITDAEASGDDRNVEVQLSHTVYDVNKKLVETGETSTLRTSLVVTSLGHKCTPDTTPFCDPSLGHIRTAGGSFTNPELNAPTSSSSASAAANPAGDTAGTSTSAETSTTGPLADESAEATVKEKAPVYGQVLIPKEGDGEAYVPLPGVYAAGWAARGAKGVLGTTMLDAHAVGESIVGEWLERIDSTEGSSRDTEVKSLAAQVREAYPQAALEVGANKPEVDGVPDAIGAALQDGDGQAVVTTYEDWLVIDAEEVKRGEARGKERERLTWNEARELLQTRRKTSS